MPQWRDPVKRIALSFQQFFATEAASGIVLLACAIAALVWANVPGDSYFHLWERQLAIGRGAGAFARPLHFWINDGLMVLFFLLVGLEIKREILAGELASPRQAALPVAGAIGGMMVPALIYTMLNAGGPGARGWAIPMATDIAFALGVLALLGRRVPPGLRVFLAALAIADDLGSVLVIAIFYASELSFAWLGAAMGIVAILVICNATGIRSLWIYSIVGVALWLAVLNSGVHATIAGVLLALTIPENSSDNGRSPLVRMERALHGVVAFVIMPLFALANAGLHLDRAMMDSLSWRVTLGVGLGLGLGKMIGISGASRIAVARDIAALPASVNWRHLFGASWLGGIGFTMSLFVASLAFGSGPLLDSAKIGILSASIVAGLIGAMVLASGRSGSTDVYSALNSDA